MSNVQVKRHAPALQPIESVVIELDANEAIALRDLLYSGTGNDTLGQMGLSKLHADLVRGIPDSPRRFSEFKEIAKLR